MKLEVLAEKIGAQIIAGWQSSQVEVNQFYADNKISELLAEACSRTLIVSNTINQHILRVAKIIDVPAICLFNNLFPEPEMVNTAKEHETVLMVCPQDKPETVKRLYQCLGLEARLSNDNSALYDRERRLQTSRAGNGKPEKAP